jgi:hypothetical protein
MIQFIDRSCVISESVTDPTDCPTLQHILLFPIQYLLSETNSILQKTTTSLAVNQPEVQTDSENNNSNRKTSPDSHLSRSDLSILLSSWKNLWTTINRIALLKFGAQFSLFNCVIYTLSQQMNRLLQQHSVLSVKYIKICFIVLIRIPNNH